MKKVDSQGNKLLIGDTGIYLKLKKDTNNKQIFAFRDGKIVKFVSKNGVMRVGGGMIGFNYYALQWIAEHKRLGKKPIYIRMNQKYYSITAQEILEKKIFLHFKSDGFDLQCFYPTKDLELA